MRNWQLALGGGTAALLLAGCGGGSGFAEESARTIVDETEKDMKALSSVTMTGQLVSDGEQLDIDMAISTSGDCEGSISVQGGEVQILSLDGASWMKPDAAFWEATAGESAPMVQEMVDDKWVVLPEDEGGFTELCDLDELLSSLGADDETEGEVDGTEDVDGQETVKVLSETDEGDPLTIWVTVDDPHLIVKMEVTEGEEPGTITFTEFDEEPDVEAPAEDDVVDLDQMGG